MFDIVKHRSYSQFLFDKKFNFPSKKSKIFFNLIFIKKTAPAVKLLKYTKKPLGENPKAFYLITLSAILTTKIASFMAFWASCRVYSSVGIKSISP